MKASRSQAREVDHLDLDMLLGMVLQGNSASAMNMATCLVNCCTSSGPASIMNSGKFLSNADNSTRTGVALMLCAAEDSGYFNLSQ